MQRVLNSNTISPLSSHGYYGRMYINNTTKNYSSASIALPETSKISVSSNGTLFIYGGFSGGSPGSVEADMGMQYSPTYDVWKPVMTITGGHSFLSDYMEGTYLNGYLPGNTVSIVCHPYNNQNGTTGSVRLKVYGLAKYSDRLGNGSNTYLTTIAESNDVFNITGVNYHKWVTSIGGSSSSVGHNIGAFSNITINGVVQASSKFNTVKDGTVTFSNIGNGTITMDVRN